MRFEKEMENIFGVFTDPMVVFNQSWADAIPKKLKEIIHIQRLVNVRNLEYATDIEALAYIMTASLCFPLDSDWTKIYMFLTKKYIKFLKKEIPDFLKDVPDELSYSQPSDLEKLKMFIKDKQLAYRKKKLKINKKFNKSSLQSKFSF
ncbi:MAG: hypothetical protein KKC53_04015 [Actinobacteria bacterium]|nr:hypothetical protein [Actinomycetota bacterium]